MAKRKKAKAKKPKSPSKPKPNEFGSRDARGKLCKVAQAFYDRVVRDWEVDADDVPTLTMIRNAAELLDRAEACRDDYVKEGVWVVVATGNGASTKVNPNIALEARLRSAFTTVCKQMGVLE